MSASGWAAAGPAEFRLGLIEGFFGKSWPRADRLASLPFLRAQGYNSYVYAPKENARLRKRWEEPFESWELDALAELAGRCRDAGLDFGVGLSPFELYRDFSPARRAALRHKLRQLDGIGLNSLYLLFDDMPGEFPRLAESQADILAFASHESRAGAFGLCPTYYSDDPILPRFFGAMPEHYLEELGQRLDPAVELFWTGPLVFSPDYPAEHLRAMTERLGRKPLIWDNYPVNDGKRLTGFLHLRPPTRDVRALRAHARGHFVNPMNEAWLSRPALAGLARAYRGEAVSGDAVLRRLCQDAAGEALGERLFEDLTLLQDRGLDDLDATERARLRARYAPHSAHPAARELLAWLDGFYSFDPACLT